MKKYILTATLILTTSTALAGVSTSGGGYAVVCRDNTNSIISAELLDLVEGKLKHNFDLKPASGSALKDYVWGAENTFYLQTGKAMAECGSSCNPSESFFKFMRSIDWVDSKSQLEPIYDLGNVTEVLGQLKQGCDIEQVAIFNDKTERVQISKEAWEKMDSLSQAGLIWHELDYRESRKYYLLPENDSEKTRLNVAIVFSKNLKPANDGVPENAFRKVIFHDPNKRQYDSTSYFRFKIFESAELFGSVFRRQFTSIGGRPVLTKTHVDIPQRVDLYKKYMLESIQFKGWYVQVVPDLNNETLSGTLVRLYNDKDEVVTNIQ